MKEIVLVDKHKQKESINTIDDVQFELIIKLLQSWNIDIEWES